MDSSLVGKPGLKKLEQDIYAVLGTVDTPAFQQMLVELVAESPKYLAAHLSNPHSIPSPSSLMECRLSSWFKATGQEPEGSIPPYWTKRAVTGVLMEPFWMAVLRQCGLDIQHVPAGVAIGEDMHGKADYFIGDNALGELKDKNGWMYKRLLEGMGLAYEEPKEYMQAQMYLQGYEREWSLYMATPDSPGMLQSAMRNYKRYKDIPNWTLPLVYLEIIDRSDKDILIGLARAKMMRADQASTTPPPREYDGLVHDKGLHPCNICRFRKECNAVNNSG